MTRFLEVQVSEMMNFYLLCGLINWHVVIGQWKAFWLKPLLRPYVGSANSLDMKDEWNNKGGTNHRTALFGPLKIRLWRFTDYLLMRFYRTSGAEGGGLFAALINHSSWRGTGLWWSWILRSFTCRRYWPLKWGYYCQKIWYFIEAGIGDETAGDWKVYYAGTMGLFESIDEFQQQAVLGGDVFGGITALCWNIRASWVEEYFSYTGLSVADRFNREGAGVFY